MRLFRSAIMPLNNAAGASSDFVASGSPLFTLLYFESELESPLGLDSPQQAPPQTLNRAEKHDYLRKGG